MVNRRKWLRLLGIGSVISLGLGLVIIYGFGFGGANKTPDQAQVGALAPDFELQNLKGETVRLSDYQGKPVLVNFWATWCAPCKLEMPNFQKYYEKYPGQFEILAIEYGEPVDTVSRFARDMGLTFPILSDPDAKVHALYRFLGYPTSYIIDQKGVLRFQHVGLMDEDALEKYLKEAGAIQ
jgi:peroxiredoxin